MTSGRCAKCIFWTEMCTNCDNGICNRYPQVVEKDYMESCGEWEPREPWEPEEKIKLDACPYVGHRNDGGTCPATDIVCPGWEDCPYYEKTDRRPKMYNTMDITPNNLALAISRIDQFIRRNPDIEIRFSKDPSVGSRVFLEAYIVIQQQQHMYKCIYGASALSFEELLLRISNGITEMKKDQ